MNQNINQWSKMASTPLSLTFHINSTTMKLALHLALFSMLLLACSQNEKEEIVQEITEIETTETTDGFDSTLAAKYGADAYGMKTYVMAFLNRGPNRPKDSAQSAELMRAHLDNIGRLAKEGKLVLAGPFYGDGDLRGIYIFDTDNIDTARAYTATDPAIIYGSLEMELIKWYGSAGLMAIPEVHKKISKEEV